MKLKLAFIALLVFPNYLISQVVGVPISDPIYQIIDRLDTKFNNNGILFTGHKYYTREDILSFLSQLDSNAFKKPSDVNDIQYLLNECNEGDRLTPELTNLSNANLQKKIYTDSTHSFYYIEENTQTNVLTTAPKSSGLLGLFYKTPANLLQFDSDLLTLRINPILDIRAGKSNQLNDLVFRNLRGLEMRAGITDKVFVYANIQESQERLPKYMDSWIDNYSFPGAGFLKTYQSSVLNKLNGYDYLTAQGIIGFHLIKPITLQFGHGKNFIGDGYRSLFLSDIGANYLFLKLNTKLGIFEYQNIFAELQSQGQQIGDELIPKKYFAAHHLSINISKWLNIGLFESIVFNRENHFEFQYLNPVIFYRTVEQMVGSPDNAMLGADLKIKVFNKAIIYGQLMLDEFIFKNLIKRNGWWGNKFGIQAGLKYPNVAGIDHLDLQIEYNQVRPYTYSHNDSTSNYSHYLQPLAHPNGANFTEWIAKLVWNPIKNLWVEPTIILLKSGEDAESLNFGSNILKPNNTRLMDFGNKQNQGIGYDSRFLGLDISYMFHHNMFLDARFFSRMKNSVDNRLDLNESGFTFGIRMNITKQKVNW